MSRSRRAVFTACFACAFSPALAQNGAPYSRETNVDGTRVELTIDRADRAKRPSDPLLEFENVVVRFRFSDAVSKSTLSGGSPAAWIDRLGEGDKTTPEQCVGKVKRFAEAGTFSRTSLDLTSFFVVILNADPTLTVVDPRFGYGDTRLLAMVPLDAPGEDWTLSADAKLLFVSMPDAGKLAAIDTATWRTVATADSVPRASRIALQPDGAYLWAAYTGDRDSGVAVIGVRDMKVVARIPTGRGYHHFAFTADSSTAFVTNPEDGTVSIVDVRKLAKVADIPAGARPTWIDYSDLARAAYVANEGDGQIVAIDAASHKVRARMTTAPGLGQIRFTPRGRFALAVNPSNDQIYVVDASSNRIVQQGKLDKGPDQIAFTDKQAYIRHRGSDSVLMIALDSLGTSADVSAADFTGGRHPVGEMSRPTPADGIVQAAGESGVLVANPGDKSVYFYMEGMAAPMGNFSDYGREPRAVLAVDRSLRERSPGVYETTAKLPGAGSYDIALLLDQPRIVSCFDLPIAADPARARYKPPKLKVQPRIAPAGSVGNPVSLEFRITLDSGQAATDLRDLIILMAGPSWQRREVAANKGNGVYAVNFTVPVAGVYTVLAGSESNGLTFAQYATVQIAGRPR